MPDVRRRAPAIAMGVLYLYLGFHALSGSQGLVKWLDYEDRAEILEARLSALQDRKASLQAEVDGLSASSLDLDALDIAARKTLFFARDDEITVWLED